MWCSFFHDQNYTVRLVWFGKLNMRKANTMKTERNEERLELNVSECGDMFKRIAHTSSIGMKSYVKINNRYRATSFIPPLCVPAEFPVSI